MAYHSNGFTKNDKVQEHNEKNTNDSNKPTYLMEHLATFTVTSETGIIYPADGMRRLLQLEKSNGIWSQKMQLCLDHPWILIMDYETGSVMEKFPASLIQEPTAFTSLDPMEMYNNILVFIVGSSGMGYNPYPEMHIFQCQSISAQDLVTDLKLLRSGKAVPGHKNVSSLPAQNPPPPVLSPAHREHDLSVCNPYRETDVEVTAINDETSSTTSEKYERDVTILNHCFDDIEKFIARLQHAAAASRELERRRRNRKSKKKDLGDGMLTMRTKPPPEKEFIDIFQKFKLSFNLLAKLKAHIHDPNAPELIHFLFTPLALIVDASHETFYDPNLPAKVVSPLLTREAVNLLMNCVTSKETELWHSLGNSWLIPRDQWKGHVPSYHPVFMDGWSPDYFIVDETESAIDIKSSREAHDSSHYNNDYFEYEHPTSALNRLIYDKRGNEPSHHEIKEPKMELSSASLREELIHGADMGARSDISIDSIERSGHNQESWLNQLQVQGANIVQVTYPRTANNDKELTVVRGEFLEVLDDTRKWWKARNWRGQIAHVPHTIVAPYHYESISSVNETNDIFNNPLYTQNYNRIQGDAPCETFGTLPEHQNSSIAQTDWVMKERLDSSSSMPTPPPFPSKNLAEINDSAQLQNDIYRELIFKKPLQERRMQIKIKKTPKVFISSESTEDEVQNWLKVKGFSEEICKQMHGLNGLNVLSFTQEQFKELNHFNEGKRLVSQITLQKQISGFTVGKTSELKVLLEKARLKSTNEVNNSVRVPNISENSTNKETHPE